MHRADAHIHLFESGYRGRDGSSPAGGCEIATYAHFREIYGIDTALVVGYEGEPVYRHNNNYIARLSRRHDWIVPLAYVERPSGDDLTTLWRQGFAGISVYLPDRTTARRVLSWSRETLDALNRHRAIISLNATPAATAQIGQVIKQLPDTRVLFSHLGLPGHFPRPPSPARARHVLGPLLGLADTSNIGVKVSGRYAIGTDEASSVFVDVLADTFGSDRLYWGSDFSPVLDHVSFADATAIPLRAALQPAVAGDNLLRLLGVDARRTF